jgi:hypothetical protein
MTPRGWVPLLLLLLTGCATGAPVGYRVAAGNLRYRPTTPRDAPDTQARAHAQKQQPLDSWSAGGGTPAALVGRVAMGAMAQVDAFGELLLHAGLDERDELPVQGSPLTPQAATRLLALLLRKPMTLGNFPPRMAVAHLLREVLEGGEASREEVLRRVQRFRGVAVLRPDGYLAWALSGSTQQKVAPVEWREGAFRAGRFELGRFYNGRSGVFRLADARMQVADEFPLADVHDDADLLSRSLDGAGEAFFELAMAIGQLLTSPMDSVAALQHLPAGVAALIASSPAYLERFQSMTRGEQIQAVAKLTTSLLATWGAAGGATRTLTTAMGGAEALVPVLSLSAEGVLVMERVAVPVGRAAAVLSGGPGAALILQRANTTSSAQPSANGPGRWEPAREAMEPPARRYQAQIAEAPEGYVYKVQGVKFDGFTDGVLLEAKGPGYAQFLGQNVEQGGWFKGFRDMVEQAERQFGVANGTPVHWHFAERAVADFMRELLRNEGLGRIKVVHTPALSKR